MSSGCQLRWTLGVSLLTMMLTLRTVHCFLPAASSPRCIRTIHYAATSGNQNQELSLYDILGASPTMTHAQLREKYTSLARKTHPDAIASSIVKAGSTSEQQQFTDIAAAWRILSDPKERLRYDRELKAKKFTNNMETLLDISISTAIPFLRKTADTTFAAAEVTGKGMHDMGQRMGRAKTILDMESRQRELEQQSSREMSRATQMYTQLENLDKTRLSILTNPNQDLSSAKAQRILDGFEVRNKRAAKQGIDALKVSERDQGKRERELETMERQMRATEDQVKEAIQGETLALQRLEQAKRDVEKAKRDMESSKKKALQVAQKEKVAQVELGKSMANLERRTEKARAALLQTEDDSLEQKSEFLAKESSRLADHSEELYMKAQEIAAQVTQRKREERQQP